MRQPPARWCSRNVFTELLRTVGACSLGQITRALYTVGGQYRRSM
jgi:methylmalonyl-CoA mutase